MNSREQRIQQLGREILDSSREEEKRKESQHRWETALLEWCMQNEELRNRVFRFIDVFPALKNPQDVFQHIREYFPRSEHRLPKPLRAGLMLTQPSFLTRGILDRVTRTLYARMANLFIGATTTDEVLEKFRFYEKQGLRLSVDLLGEKTMHQDEADVYEARYRDLILALGQEKKGPEFQNVSVKLSSLEPHFSSLDREGVIERAGERLRRLLTLAGEHKVFLHLDMEDYESRDLTLDVVESVLDSKELPCGISLGLVLQAYLRDAPQVCERMLSLSSKRDIPLTIRLVRGAYWDTEVMRARELHWPVPVFTAKPETDAVFESLIERILNHIPKVRLAVATHNVRSLAAAWAIAEEKKIPSGSLEFQFLYGMGEPLVPALKPSGYPLRFYMPIGEPVVGMAYLVRRLLENVSSQSFVRKSFHEAGKIEDLLKAPPKLSSVHEEHPPRPEHNPLAFLRFHDASVRASFEESLEAVHRDLGCDVPVVVNGKEIKKGELLETVSPVDAKTRIVRFFCAGKEEASSAVEIAREHQSEWGRRSPSERALCLRKAADLMSERRYELAALAVWEAGKTWRDADAEVIEAVDFLRYYAFHAERIFQGKTTEDLDQETNRLEYLPRGVTAVIAPWNFPMAILTGMSSAALAAGNPVILKPAEQSVLSAWKIFQIYRQSGIPDTAIHFLPGRGEIAGDSLVRHPATAVIAFTGSRDAGLSILSAAHKKESDQRLVKKCIVEMGGKNPAIIDASADFDLAIPEVLQSAFGYAGQKCSALSRLIIVDAVYEEFLNRLAKTAAEFLTFSPLYSRAMAGPVIDREAFEKISSFIKEGKEEGHVIYEGKISKELQGFYVAPVIFSDLPAASRLLKEEIFGPVLCVLRARDFDEALRMTGGSEYALTAAIYSRTPGHLEKARHSWIAGNLYLNRSQTGAIVGRQPFGGFKLSGGGTKAGGEDYLKEFSLMKTVTENITRHGFAPLK